MTCATLECVSTVPSEMRTSSATTMIAASNADRCPYLIGRKFKEVPKVDERLGRHSIDQLVHHAAPFTLCAPAACGARVAIR